MRKIAVISQKGGAGKTAVSLGISSGLYDDGHTVIMFDCDQQATSAGAIEKDSVAVDDGTANAFEILPVPDVDISMLDKLLGLMAGRLSVEYVVFDTPPVLSSQYTAIAAMSDLIVVPIVPSEGDFDSTMQTLEVLKTVETPVIILINRAPKKSDGKKWDEYVRIKDQLSKQTGFALSSVEWRDRDDFSMTAKGWFPVLSAPRSEAARETKKLCRLIVGVLNTLDVKESKAA